MNEEVKGLVSSMTKDAERTGENPDRTERRVRDGIPEGTLEVYKTSRPEQKPKPHTETMHIVEQMVTRENMLSALKRVTANKGAPGCDGMTVEALKPWLVVHWEETKKRLLEGIYQPAPVLRVEIPKPGGKGVRKLGIPTVVDRLIQQALLQVLTPLFDPEFSEHSYGFRPRRSAHQALLAAKDYVTQGHEWVVDMDLEKFFDNVNHDILMARVMRRVKDKRVLRLIRRYLGAGVMEQGIVTANEGGTPQGGPLSPLLSNIMLDELDKELERRGHRFCRYADDCNIYVKSEEAGKRVLQSVTGFLWRRLKLKVNPKKSAVAKPSKRKFLGYSLTGGRMSRLRIAPESIQRLKGNLKALFRTGRGQSLKRTIEELSPRLRGWAAYFKLCETKNTLITLDEWIRRRLRCLLWRQWKRSATKYQRLCQAGLDPARARSSAVNGRGAWWNAGASHMNHAFPLTFFSSLGLVSLLDEVQRLGLIHRTAGYGTVRPVV